LCTTTCAEGALILDDEGKAALVKEIYCDGLGACLDVCPTGALKIVERDSADYDAPAAYRHVFGIRGAKAAGKVHGALELAPQEEHQGAAAGKRSGRADNTGEPSAGSRASARRAGERSTLACGCPGSAALEIHHAEETAGTTARLAGRAASELRQWPVQLHLVSPIAPYFRGADLLIAADCTAFALGSFHGDLLRGKMLVIACPKLDDPDGYLEKLTEIIRENALKSLTVAIMTVPCCSGLYRLVDEAVRRSGVDLSLEKKVIHIDGRIVD
jgi:ferredoxin